MDNIILRENEKIEDLQCKGLKIIQNKKGFCFGMDAVLLANYCDLKKNSKVVDLGTGTGIIPVLLCGKKDVSKVIGIEIQEEVAEMAVRSVEMNNLDSKINIMNIDLNNAEDYLEINSFDAVVTNPPYKLLNSGIINHNDKKAISRHEVKCTLEDVVKELSFTEGDGSSSRLLKHHGRLFMIHRPQRLVDIMCLLRQYKLEPKHIRLVHPIVGEKPNMVLIKAVKAASRELRFDKPLYVYNDDRSYTDEIYKIYNLKK